MFDLADEFLDSSNNEMNVEIVLVREENGEVSSEIARLNWRAPEENYKGVSVTFTMVYKDGQCILN